MKTTAGKNQVLFLTLKVIKMDCQLCQKDMDAYRGGKLPGDMMTQVEAHLKACKTCSEIYNLQVIADKIIEQEIEVKSDPFLATRVMAEIDNLEDSGYKPETAFTRMLKPVLVTVSMAAAIFFGIMLGNLSGPVPEREKIPVELALIDDASIESVDFLLNE